MKCACDSIGKRRHRVTVKKPVYTQDTANEQIATYVPYMSNVSAFCRPLSAREAVQAEMVQGAVAWEIELGWSTKAKSITSDMQMTLHTFGNRLVSCDGPALPALDDNGFPTAVKVRAQEQTA